MPQRICSESLVEHPSAASQKSVDGSADPAQGIHQRFASLSSGLSENTVLAI